jgi:limonene-1,2-epoxide hydrolase
MSTFEQIARLFIEAINHQDLDQMKRLLDVDHRFTDSLGTSVEGREPVLAAWRTYFGWMPDYRIEIEEFLVRGRRVAMFGAARGTFAPEGALREENRWELPAAWLAEVRENLIESWRVYADNKPVYEIMKRYRPGSTDT